MASDRTIKMKKRYRELTALSYTLEFMPICAFVIPAFVQGNTKEKLIMGLTAIFALLVVLINRLNKVAPRSALWIILVGINLAIQNLMPVIITMAVCCLIDEIIVTPAQKDIKEKYKINKEIDYRE